MKHCIDIDDIVRLEFSDHFQDYTVWSYHKTNEIIFDTNGVKQHYAVITLISTGNPDAKEVQSSRIPIPSSTQEEQPLLWDV